jgi:hypothetical protein
MANTNSTHAQGWPEPYTFTVYDCMFGDFPAKDTVYTPYIHKALANTNSTHASTWP